MTEMPKSLSETSMEAAQDHEVKIRFEERLEGESDFVSGGLLLPRGGGPTYASLSHEQSAAVPK